jgi:uncharacterized protein (TIGR03435 family)
MVLTAMVAAPIITFAIIGPADLAPSNPFVGTIPLSSTAASARHVSGATAYVSVLANHDWRNDVMPWLVIAWLTGVILFWVRLTGGWIVAARMRSMLMRPAPPEWQRRLDDIKARIRISRPVKLLVSALVQVPAVVGCLRPVVLVPIGALAGLPPEQIEALLAHELAHIKRHDYFVNILQSVAEALLFYHPAVWWVSNQIRNERELCCDDVAISVAGDVLTYARALADLEARRPGRLNPVLAANGGSLRDRIARLLDQPARGTRPLTGPAALAATALIFAAAYGLFAQAVAAPTSFDVVSIKPNNLSGGEVHEHNSPGRLNASMTARHLIQDAFGIKDFQISGGPAWLGNDNYDFVATTAAPIKLSDKVLEPLLQSLLADRFHLKYHRETKEFPVYSLVTAKNGPKLTKHTGTPGHSMDSYGGKDKRSMTATSLTMTDLASFLAQQMDRPVIDNTGIKGEFDVKLEWSPDQIGESSGPSVFTALQEQLGLRLESGKGPVEILVIDSIEKPSEN